MTACQWTGHRPCEMPAVYSLTFRSKHGFEWIEVQCRAHVDQRTVQVRAEGGEIVAVSDIPQPPAPIEPAPVGLDAVDPPPPPEPVKVRVPRRRRGRQPVAGRDVRGG